MGWRAHYRLALSALLAGVLAPRAFAVSVPIVNPGFNANVNGAGFIYENIFYLENDPMPDHTYTTEDISGGADHVSGIGDSASGAVIPDGAVTMNGYTGSPGTGLVYDTRDYLPGKGPQGPGAYISFADNAPRGIFQVLTGIAFQPNTAYTFTADVSDRRFGAGDNVTFPSGGTTVPKGVSLSLSGGAVEPAGVFTFTAPPAGGTSQAKYVFSTGPAGTVGDPTGDISLILRAQGFAGGAATQAIFDNLALDASPAAPANNADFDGDHDVDGADFLIWQRGLNSGTAHAQGDANSSGSVTGADLAIWKSSFGTTVTLAAAAPVPEPGSLPFIVTTIAALAGRCRCRNRMS